jgi:crotonobetainyl-CoA:carnitine CoA-transferase CaiB-like acyl-CoA transferase
MPGDRPRPFSQDGALRVLDVGTQVAGPFAATLLGDLGADVIKCEQPGTGDPIRAPDGLSPRWQSDGRNKRSITLNLRVSGGQVLLRRLAERADVLVENFRPGTMERWGLGNEDLAAVNPRLVYVSVSGFGSSGPNSSRPGYDPIGSAFGGLMGATRGSDGRPVLPGLWVVDHMTGMLAALGALEAIRRRETTGRGDRVEIALYESVLRLTGHEMISLSSLGSVPERNTIPPFRTRDGRWVMVFPVGESQYARLHTLIDDPALSDSRFATRADRQQNADAYHAILAAWVGRHDRARLLDTLGEIDVPSSPVHGFDDFFENEHIVARRNVTEIVNACEQPVKMPSPVPRFDAAPAPIRWAGEELGASNRDVYVDMLGLDDDELQHLADLGVV